MKIKFPASILLWQLTLIIAILSSPLTAQVNSHHIKKPKPTNPGIHYYIDSNADGKFEQVFPEAEPIPLQGKESFVCDLTSNITYPTSARRNGIAGYVILDVSVNELGKVTDVRIQQSLTEECDRVSIAAFKAASANGYATWQRDSVYVAYKMAYPIGFSLQ